MKRVLVTGATGFIGRRLLREVLRRGDSVVALTRDRSRLRGAELLSQTAAEPGAPGAGAAQQGQAAGERLQVVEGDPAQAGPWQEALRGCDAVVALHGEPIAGRRWSADFKQRAEDSRVEGMRRIVEAITRLPKDERPRVLVGGSAVGYYGPHGDEKLTEASGQGEDFLARLCGAWEAAARAAPAELRVVAARIGVVLGPGGGVLQKMVPAFRAFVGGPIGSGRQWVSWIHLEDAVGLLLHVLAHEAASGPVNVTAPEPVTMTELAAGLGRALHRPSSLKVPGLAVRLLFGEGADPLLTGQRVWPARALELGYRFRFPTLDQALADVLHTP